MKTFKEFLEERALNIGNKSVSYPKFGNILILAGGAGSGKGFAKAQRGETHQGQPSRHHRQADRLHSEPL